MSKKSIVGDILALVFVAIVVSYLAIFTEQFLALTKAYPIPLGAVKFGVLAPFGGLLAWRLFRTKRWEINLWLIPKALLWGLTGVWITAGFLFASTGTVGVITGGLWPDASGVGLAFSKSLWINFFGGFGFTMMFFHELAERLLCGPIRNVKAILESMAKENWFVITVIFLFVFWIPAHTVTFSLPREWQVLMAACLSVVLGLTKTWIATRRVPAGNAPR